VKSIRIDNVSIGSASDTKRAEAIALLMQGATLSGIALNYDKAQQELRPRVARVFQPQAAA
jgi:hypothetical protein